MNVAEIFQKGGVTMVPLLLLSVLSLSVIIERLWFWLGALTKEREIVNRVLDTARRDWPAAAEVARQAYDQPIGRFLYSPLQLVRPDPDLFRLSLEAAAEDELAAMRRGDKVLEAVIALAPLLGLLGTVIGLIISLQSIRIGDIATGSAAGVTTGIGEALISTAAGLVVAIGTLAFYRTFQGFLFTQIKLFRKAGNDLELLYRQRWLNQDLKQVSQDVSPDVWRSESSRSDAPQSETLRSNAPLMGETSPSSTEQYSEQRPESPIEPSTEKSAEN